MIRSKKPKNMFARKKIFLQLVGQWNHCLDSTSLIFFVDCCKSLMILFQMYSYDLPYDLLYTH
jgi:hypothetical protein